MLGPDWNGRILLRASGPTVWFEEELVSFTLWIGDLGVTLKSALKAPDLVLEARNSRDLGAAQDALRAATPDTRLRLELAILPSGIEQWPHLAPAQTLTMALGVATIDHPQLPVETPVLVFGDPSYDRILGSATVEDARRDAQGNLWTFAVDREAYDQTAPLYFAILGPDGVDNDCTVTIRRIREGVADAVISLLKQKPGIYVSTLGELASRMLGPLEPGDRLHLSLAVEGATAHSLFVTVSADPVMAPAPAVYHLLVRGETTATVALSASGPVADTIEFPDLAKDFRAGFIRRRALFVWPFAPQRSGSGEHAGYLIKVDRSGSAQLPDEPTAFVPFWSASTGDGHSTA